MENSELYTSILTLLDKHSPDEQVDALRKVKDFLTNHHYRKAEELTKQGQQHREYYEQLKGSL